METTNKSAPILLIVDDEVSLTDLFTELFRGDCYNCFVAHDGEEAIKVLGEQPLIHAILCDIQMPRMSGLEFLKHIRDRGDLTPFVFLTADRKRESVIEALKLGAFDFLDKPFELRKLINTVTSAIDLGVQLKGEANVSINSEKTNNPTIDSERVQNQLNLMRALILQNRKAS